MVSPNALSYEHTWRKKRPDAIWGDAVVLVPWAILKETGEISILGEVYIKVPVVTSRPYTGEQDLPPTFLFPIIAYQSSDIASAASLQYSRALFGTSASSISSLQSISITPPPPRIIISPIRAFATQFSQHRNPTGPQSNCRRRQENLPSQPTYRVIFVIRLGINQSILKRYLDAFRRLFLFLG